jgi:hypothetical protein
MAKYPVETAYEMMFDDLWCCAAAGVDGPLLREKSADFDRACRAHAEATPLAVITSRCSRRQQRHLCFILDSQLLLGVHS